MRLPWFLSFLVLLTVSAVAQCADEFERPPIEYSRSTPDNRVSQLQSRLERGELRLPFEEGFGYLRGLLDALGISPESQMLVFSKTSKQRNAISPRTPRAIYFNDEVYLGYCNSGDFLEVSVADPKLGAVFYTLEQTKAEAPLLVRQTDSCLQCHGTSQTNSIPGHLVRSVFVDGSGLPILSAGSRRVDHTTPLDQRWGGWYVSGKHAQQTHQGNLIVRNADAPQPFDNAAGQNLTDISSLFSADKYLTPHSDIVALMVLEHQALVHNLITQAGFTTRQALRYEAELNQALNEPKENRLESTERRIKNVGDKLVEGLLFVEEAKLAAPISGTSRFSEMFATSGPRDSKGRGLRDFDLTTRMFKYPCSYLIYSPSFDGLPEEVKTYALAKIHGVLTGKDDNKAFSHLSADDRRAILEILSETKPGPWKQ